METTELLSNEFIDEHYPHSQHQPDECKACDEIYKQAKLANLLTEKLNHAVTELTRAALSEDYDSDDCMRCVEEIQTQMVAMGKTSDWHRLSHWYDRFAAAMVVSNEDEIDVYKMAEERLIASRECVAKL